MAALVNDVHSGLNSTTVGSVHAPRSIEELQCTVNATAAAGGSLSISGARHAMGGQQFLTNRTLVDTRHLCRVLNLDHRRGLLTAEAGIQWPQLIQSALRLQEESDPGLSARWGIAQKQTGADALTLGGAVSANAHGRGLMMKPLIADIEAFTLLNARGELIECSRGANADLFALAIGGYGLFGPIVTVTLRLTHRRKLRRVVRVIDIEDAVHAVRRRIDEGCIYGDFQFDIDPASPGFLTKGVFACYQPVPDDVPMPADQRQLRADEWQELLYLAHVDKQRAFQLYARHYLATDGQLYWSDTHQLGVYLDGYHQALDRRMNAPVPCGEMITELYIPPDRLVDFLRAAAGALIDLGSQVIYGTIRLIQKDNESFLPWARDTFACIIFNLHVESSPAGMQRASTAFRSLIDLSLDRGGTFYLTYHRFATRQQLLSAYPQLPEFLRRKDAHDPAHVFSSDWHQWLCKTLG